MSRYETLDGSNWEEFIQSPYAVLILGKTTCENCARWTDELTAYLETDSEFVSVRFGKLLLDQPGLIGFKKANLWLAEVDVLPYNLIYANGEKVKDYAGGGLSRLQNRLRRIMEG
ncbi:MAG: hypothetical protein CMJ78_18830 [Planctomycetaceae bacterium]|nr:hypothetical protein [Planctomycetaceae bacterium]